MEAADVTEHSGPCVVVSLCAVLWTLLPASKQLGEAPANSPCGGAGATVAETGTGSPRSFTALRQESMDHSW